MYLSTPPFLCLSHHLMGFIVIFLIQYVKKDLLGNYVFYSIGLFNNQAKKLPQLLSAGFVLGTEWGLFPSLWLQKRKKGNTTALSPTFLGRQTTFIRKVVIKLN